MQANHLLSFASSPIVARRAPAFGFERRAPVRYARAMGKVASPSICHLLPVLLAATLVAGGTAAARLTCSTVQGPAGAPFPDCALGQAHNILPPGADGLVNAAEFAQQEAGQGRSEERRVGKEGRSRWSPYH